MSKCPAIIEFGDDYGDNVSTFHCQLEEGHEGKHKEVGHMYNNQSYELMWEDPVIVEEEEA